MVLERHKMKNITIELPEVMIAAVEGLQLLGVIPSRSEAIRRAVLELLQREGRYVEGCAVLSQIRQQHGEDTRRSQQ
jgi:Arc/MetJ-type ribon-helix-helix transcriptional regulator